MPSNPSQQVFSPQKLAEIRARQAFARAVQAARPVPHIWTPGGPVPVSEADKPMEILDSEKIAIKRIMDWHNNRQGVRRNVHEHVQDLTQRFLDIGFVVDVKVDESGDVNPDGTVTPVPGRYEYTVEIIKRTTPFDPEKMHHEVVNNILDIPGEYDSAINVDGGMVNALANQDVSGSAHDCGDHS